MSSFLTVILDTIEEMGDDLNYREGSILSDCTYCWMETSGPSNEQYCFQPKLATLEEMHSLRAELYVIKWKWCNYHMNRELENVCLCGKLMQSGARTARPKRLSSKTKAACYFNILSSRVAKISKACWFFNIPCLFYKSISLATNSFPDWDGRFAAQELLSLLSPLGCLFFKII